MLEHPFNSKHYNDQTDSDLVAKALNGSKQSLEQLLARHHTFVYNLVWKMVLNPQNAEDITQDILIKVITKLSQFQKKSKFRTWLYRIAVNHVLNVKKQFREFHFTDFESVASTLNQLPDNPESEEMEDINEDVRISCTAGMLLCLDRKQRITFILGAIFGIDSKLGADILRIKPSNFRQRLSRARKDLHSFMNDNCGLINKSNPCRCPKKTRAFIANGWADPHDLKFNTRIVTTIYDSVPTKNEQLLEVVETQYRYLFAKHPLQQPLKGAGIVDDILSNKDIASIFNL